MCWFSFIFSLMFLCAESGRSNWRIKGCFPCSLLGGRNGFGEKLVAEASTAR